LSGQAKEPPRAWQRMLSGRRLDLLDPSPLDVEIEDIAHGLARVARWNGQTLGDYPYSVAQHSLFVEAIAGHLRLALPPATRLAILLHDAAEYVIGDMISPFKAIIGDGYKETEAKLMAAIMIRFGLPREMKGQIKALAKEADTIAAWHEATELAGFDLKDAGRFFGAPVRLPAEIAAMVAPWPTSEAQRRFLARFRALEQAGH
jgi:uncharacterized protein